MRKAKLALAVMLTVRGIPQLYYGDELGITGGNEHENKIVVSYSAACSAFDAAGPDEQH